MNSKVCEVTLHPSSVSFIYQKRSGKTVVEDISYAHVLAVEEKGFKTQDNNDNDIYAVTVHYVRQVSNRRLRIMSQNVQSDYTTCKTLVTRLEEELSVTERPKRLAVIINPNSGKKRAEKVFKNKVQPVFTLCGIHTEVHVTKTKGDALQHVRDLNLADVDGVVTVGGDGLYCEVMNGLLLSTQKDHGVNADDPKAKVVPADIPIGIIPAGSGNWVTQYLHGTRDVMTAILHVVTGFTSRTNAVSVHQGGKVSAYAGLVLCFGLQGDMMNDCEKFRWMGPNRYAVIPISTVLSRRTFDVEIEYEDDVTGELTRMSDWMYSVDTYVISRREQGDKLVPLFGDSALSVYTSSKCSLGKHVQQLTKLQDQKAGCFDYDFVKTVRTQGYKVRFPRAAVSGKGDDSMLKEKCYISCDGDVLQVVKPEFEVRLHHNAIRLYGDAVN
ncbi:hypothetical protein BaRGS_00006643 [Batillaria attramentaria]|uniref:DAGKc domain-containing protein n=1 Tax=Batillaria attramentaria TaxID=370345 RepID=A0ABD0LRF1_9CAEN